MKKSNSSLTWEEVVASEATEVTILSYGYTEHSIFGHYEPFGKQRKLVFHIVRFQDGTAYLDHPTFFLEEDESELSYEKDRLGKITVFDPDLGARPDY